MHKRFKRPSGKSVFQERYKAEEFCEGKILRAYKCDKCNFYHVTKKVREVENVKLKYKNKFKKYLAAK